MKSSLPKFALALVLSTLAVYAEPPSELEKQLAESVKAARAQMTPATTFNIDFPGGTIRDFLSAAAKIQGVSISIVSAGGPEDLETPLPPVSLRNTSPIITLQVLSRLLISRGYDLGVMDSGPNSAVAVLTPHEAPKPPKHESNSFFQSFQLAQYLTEQSIDDIVGAIRAAWELDPKHDPKALQLKFHPATSILLVSGPPEGLNVATQIVSQLKRPNSNSTPKSAAPPETEKR
jgi:type II secretory pathway component GspD/PulD (secretin)